MGAAQHKAGKSAVGIPAPASTPEFLVRLLGQRYQIDLTAVPYRGSAPMIADMLGNQIPAGIGSVQDFIENHRAGKLRVLAVLGARRQAALPDVPTFAELGLKGFEDTPYYGFYAPAGTPQAFIQRFSDALAQVVAIPEVRDQLTAMGLTVGAMTPEQLTTRERATRRCGGASSWTAASSRKVQARVGSGHDDNTGMRGAMAALLAASGHGGRRTALTVTSLSPQGEVAQVRQVVAKFDEPAVRLGDPQAPAPFTLACSDADAAKGQARWSSEREWVYEFAQDLPPGVRCTVSAKPGFKSASGAPLLASAAKQLSI